VLFDTKETNETKLREKIEKQLALKLGYEVPTIVRSIEDIKTAIKNSPFSEPQTGGTRKLYVTFLAAQPDVALHGALDIYKNEHEDLKVIDRELYIVSGGIGNSKLSLNLIEKKLGVSGTMRNWATVNKILEL
jgi:uncharacterized protein (DUF1697 family)